VYLKVNNPVDTIKIYVGPQSNEVLKKYGLEGVISFGFFHIIGVALLNLLKLFYSLTKSWGTSIILLSMTAYGIMFPFTAKSTKAMKKMQQVQPEVEAIKQKYKDNPQKMNKEVMELYKKYKLNPLGGCLPLFFQFPIFISLYQILLRFVQLKGASFLWIKDLSMPDRLLMFPGGFKLPILNAEYFNLLPILVMTLGIIQQKVTTSSSTAGEQKKIGLFFAVFLGFIFYNFPSALVLYWFVQNLLTLTYQYRISRQ
jgi:YidC/Oxa1 family membrane protein insertase